MAKQTLADTVDESEIIDLTQTEEVNVPNILIDDNYGIQGRYGDYSLLERVISLRTGKEEDGVNNGKVIRYISWNVVTPHSYGRTIFDVLRNYSEYSNLTKIKALKKCKDFEVVENIYKSTNTTINKFLSTYTNITKEQSTIAELIDMINKLKSEVATAKSVFVEVDELRELVKTKRKIVVGDEPKKHRTKKEEE